MLYCKYLNVYISKWVCIFIYAHKCEKQAPLFVLHVIFLPLKIQLFISIYRDYIHIYASCYIQTQVYKNKSPLSWLAETKGTLCVLNLLYNVYTVHMPLTLAPAFSFSATYSSLFQLPSTDKSQDRHTDDFFKLPLNSFSQKRIKLIRKI